MTPCVLLALCLSLTLAHSKQDDESSNLDIIIQELKNIRSEMTSLTGIVEQLNVSTLGHDDVIVMLENKLTLQNDHLRWLEGRLFDHDMQRGRHDVTVKTTSPTDDAMITDDRTASNTAGGAVYTRWGRTTCDQGTDTVYSGLMGKSYRGHATGTNYQCLPHDPQYANYVDTVQGSSPMYGTQFDGVPDAIFDADNLNGTTFYLQDVPCAVCHVSNRTSVLVVPARTQCPPGWTQQYWGYLVSAYWNYAEVSTYECMDHAPEVVGGGSSLESSSYVLTVEAVCGVLPCPSYVDGWELTCVVCSM